MVALAISRSARSRCRFSSTISPRRSRTPRLPPRATVGIDPRSIPAITAAGVPDANVPQDVYLGYGGAIAVEGNCTLTIVDSNITSNTASIGGALYLRDSTLVLENTTIADSNRCQSRSTRLQKELIQGRRVRGDVFTAHITIPTVHGTPRTFDRQ